MIGVSQQLNSDDCVISHRKSAQYSDMSDILELIRITLDEGANGGT